MPSHPTPELTKAPDALFKTLEQAIQALLPLLQDHQIILLRGDLASGKTTLVSELAQSIGIQEAITSPTFSLQNIHPHPSHTIFHYDLYRRELGECLELGLLEMLSQRGWHFIEWGDERLESILKQSGFAMIIVSITQAHRLYRISEV